MKRNPGLLYDEISVQKNDPDYAAPHPGYATTITELLNYLITESLNHCSAWKEKMLNRGLYPMHALWALFVYTLSVASLSLAAVAVESALDAPLTAAQIVEKHIAARGGTDAWQKVQTMVWVGRVESESTPAHDLPFMLELKRPNKTRFEISALSQKSIRIFDGKDGWKVKPAANGKPEFKPYTNEELKFAREAQVIDGPLMDFANKGSAITLEGEEELEGRKSYRLNVRSLLGVTQHVWIDAESFLEVKYERVSRNAAGMVVAVPVFLRNYQNFEGLQIPTIIETGFAPGRTDAAASDKMVIEKLALNPELGDERFSRPKAQGRRSRVVVDTRDLGPPPPRKVP